MTEPTTCPDCGTVVGPGVEFCPACGWQLGPVDPSEEVRKVVTVLFADVSGSTAIGERLDAEILRGLMNRYFTRMRAIIEGHGGTVEKFIGDAVMAVFGIPRVHEDDALRAVRAAADIRDALDAMNAYLEAQRGIAIRFRTGINTGEVVAGDLSSTTTLVTGDTVNTAARLEQAAPPGGILLGRLTWSLVRDAVDAEPVQPITAKGKAEPLDAWRLVSVRTGAAGRLRKLDATLVGREDELAALTGAWRTAVDERSTRLAAIVGGAGVGKSRLVRELVRLIEGSGRVVVGRCLSYGDGITYWPLREIAHAAAGITEADDRQAATARLHALLENVSDGPIVASRVAAAIGLSTERVPQEEVFWAARRLLEHLATGMPTLVIVEDVHWAEDTFLDLLDHVLDRTPSVPMLVLATARPDLVDRRPAFGEGRPNEQRHWLDPLGDEAVATLLDVLPGGTAIPAAVRERILAAAEGNPLYVEEVLAMLRDDGLLREQPDGTWEPAAAIGRIRIPPTVQALLAARLEALPDHERRVARRASVIGRSFEVDALQHLERQPLAGELTGPLLALVRKELLRPDRAELTVGDAFRFRHVLIRDAAYEALPKTERAVLHERVADWIQRVAGDRLAELEEIVGYHLEQAYRYRLDLGERTERVAALGRRAGTSLASAGRRAYARRDIRAAIRLLEPAATLLGDTPSGDEARADLIEALMDAGSSAAAAELTDELERRAADRDDRVLAGRVAVVRLELVKEFETERVTQPSFDDDLRRARAIVEASASDKVQGRFWHVWSTVLWDRDDFAAAEVATATSLDFARRSGVADDIAMGLLLQAIEALSGTATVPTALSRFEEVLAFPGTGMMTRAESLHRKGILEAMDGRPADGRATAAAGVARLEELGVAAWVPEALRSAAWVERLAGDYEAEAVVLERAIRQARSTGQDWAVAWYSAILALALAKRGRVQEARDAYAVAEPDAYTRTVRTRRTALARLLAAEGRRSAALETAAEVEADVMTNLRAFPNAVSDNLIETGVVAFIAGDEMLSRRRASVALETALAKENRALERKARLLLAGDIRGL